MSDLTPRELIEATQQSQGALAARLGVARATVNRWATGRVTMPETARLALQMIALQRSG
jgi:DNA-binding transcriptional regulator YiaG